MAVATEGLCKGFPRLLVYCVKQASQEVEDQAVARRHCKRRSVCNADRLKNAPRARQPLIAFIVTKTRIAHMRTQMLIRGCGVLDARFATAGGGPEEFAKKTFPTCGLHIRFPARRAHTLRRSMLLLPLRRHAAERLAPLGRSKKRSCKLQLPIPWPRSARSGRRESSGGFANHNAPSKYKLPPPCD